MWTLDHVTFAVRTGVLGPVGGSHGDGQGNGDDGGGGVVMVVVLVVVVMVTLLEGVYILVGSLLWITSLCL